ncbi:hypothetical protein [Pseudolysinimonas sp.]
MRIAIGHDAAAFTRHVLDIVYVVAILALTALVVLVAKGVEKL